MAEDVRVAAFLHAKASQDHAVRDAALACVEPTRAEAGNEMYVLHRDAQDPLLFVFMEHWKSQQALDQHMQTPHFKALTQALDGKLAQPMIVHVLHPV
ncbi:putative quinol monooxygenase [Rhodopila sp.]|uniref:putative quinol monooxygenase n=1 Tax=Rhodopila sp. TaxID=2480087 RepID=UPI003D0C4297